jgi:hypothetical protein
MTTEQYAHMHDLERCPPANASFLYSPMLVGQSALIGALPELYLLFPEPVLWVCDDSPTDGPNRDLLLKRLAGPFDGPTIISSPVPPGTIAWLEGQYPGREFAYVIENVRRASAYHDLVAQEWTVGTNSKLLWKLLCGVHPCYRTTPESAELGKLALNSFLSLNIAFMHEISDLAQKVSADADAICEILRRDERVSSLAPLRPGPSWGGDHLARDVDTLQQLGHEFDVSLPLISRLRSDG